MTTFSCSVCGSAGDVLEDPAKDGLQPDQRPNPQRHQMALRLRALGGLNDPFGDEAARESLPQASKPYRVPLPGVPPVPLPIRTFRRPSASGSSCSSTAHAVTTGGRSSSGAEHLDGPFAGGRFICRHLKLKVYGEGREVCGSPRPAIPRTR